MKRQGSRPAFFCTRTVSGRYEDTARFFDEITTSDDYVGFLTLPGYQWLTRTLRDPVEA
jgi:hypothetical protein